MRTPADPPAPAAGGETTEPDYLSDALRILRGADERGREARLYPGEVHAVVRALGAAAPTSGETRETSEREHRDALLAATWWRLKRIDLHLMAHADEATVRLRELIAHWLPEYPSSPASGGPTNAQHESPFPGADTVVTSLRDPDSVVHRAHPECAEEAPHAIARCGRFASGGPTVAEQFAAHGWDLASIADAAAELERLSGMVRSTVVARIAAENERDNARDRLAASGGPGVGREEELRRALQHVADEIKGQRETWPPIAQGAHHTRVYWAQVEGVARAALDRAPAGPPRETGPCAYDATLVCATPRACADGCARQRETGSEVTNG